MILEPRKRARFQADIKEILASRNENIESLLQEAISKQAPPMEIEHNIPLSSTTPIPSVPLDKEEIEEAKTYVSLLKQMINKKEYLGGVSVGLLVAFCIS